MKADRERITREFCQLVSIDSESLKEREMADVLKKMLEEIGFTVEEDNVGEKIGGNAGNLYGILPGDPALEPILLSGHMDTVKPGIGKRAKVLPDGKIISEGDTVLGSDDLSGVIEILEGVRIAKASGKPLGDIEVLFSVCEESYGGGASVFDYGKVKSKIAYALDLTGFPGRAAIKAPSIVSFNVKVNGKAAHAGFEPEKGINALKVAVDAAAKIDVGHVDEFTVNIGKITGGKASNIVCETCKLVGEVRGFNHQAVLGHVEKIGKIFKEEAEKLGATVEFDYIVAIKAFDIPPHSHVCEKFIRACNSLGLEGGLESTYGGSDNAYFVENGIEGIVLSCGMYDVHSVNEYTFVEDMAVGAELMAEILTN